MIDYLKNNLTPLIIGAFGAIAFWVAAIADNRIMDHEKKEAGAHPYIERAISKQREESAVIKNDIGHIKEELELIHRQQTEAVDLLRKLEAKM